MQHRFDSLAQQVEHNTFNVGVLGSSPRRITKRKPSITKLSVVFLFIYSDHECLLIIVNRLVNYLIYNICFQKMLVAHLNQLP